MVSAILKLWWWWGLGRIGVYPVVYHDDICIYMYTCVVGIDICNGMCALLDIVYNMATCVCVCRRFSSLCGPILFLIFIHIFNNHDGASSN